MIQWLRAQTPPCPYNEITRLAAARRGQLVVLKWLRAQTPPCPWNGWVISSTAVIGGHLEMLQWVLAQTPSCPWKEPMS